MLNLNDTVTIGLYLGNTVQWHIDNHTDYLETLAEENYVVLSEEAIKKLDEALWQVEFDEGGY